jgi:hypothetical protein
MTATRPSRLEADARHRTAAALAAWGTVRTIEADNPVQEDVRCEILADAGEFTAYGVRDGRVLLITPLGMTLVSPSGTTGGRPIVVFDHLACDRSYRTRFWMNASSVADLGDRLRARPECRRPFDSFFAP